MLQRLRPPVERLHPPFANYVHGIEVPSGMRLVVLSGQLGIAPDGAVPHTAEGQAELCFANILAVLEEAGLGRDAIVRINGFVTGREHLKGYMAARDRFFGDGPVPASTLVIVGGFTREEFFVEIEAIAAGPAR